MQHTLRRRWIKLWTQETLHGTTFTELTPAQRSVWFGELLMAGDSPEPGKICIAKDIGFTEEQRAAILHVPLDLLKEAELLLIKHKKISKNGNDIIEIVNWDKYQSFDKAEYMADYMRTYRSKSNSKSNSKQTNETLTKNINGVNTNCMSIRQDKIILDKNYGYINTEQVDNNLGDIYSKPVVLQPPPENVYKIYENNIGLITQIVAEELKALENKYPLEWFIEAVKESVNNNVKSLKYIKSILQRWDKDGFKVDKRKKAKQDPPPKKYKDGVKLLEELREQNPEW